MLRLRGGGNWGPGPDACGDGKEGNGAEGRRGPAWRRRASGAGKDRMGWGWGDDWGDRLKGQRAREHPPLLPLIFQEEEREGGGRVWALSGKERKDGA